jgi:thiamine-phosphate pyrophosphorylase
MSERKAAPAARLMLVTPWIGKRAQADLVALACGAGDIAAVIARLAPAADDELAALIRALSSPVHDKGTALLLQDRAALAVKTGADGAHLSTPQAFCEAVASLKPGSIAGAGGLLTRHEAMQAGEVGADYVMFGEADAAGKRPSLSAIVERVGWWAEIFEVPCVAYAAALDEIAALVQAGADFIAVADAVWADQAIAPAAIADALSRLTAAAPAGPPART